MRWVGDRMTDDYIMAGKSNVEILLEKLIEEVRNQHELDRINATVLQRRASLKDSRAPEEEE